MSQRNLALQKVSDSPDIGPSPYPGFDPLSCFGPPKRAFFFVYLQHFRPSVSCVLLPPPPQIGGENALVNCCKPFWSFMWNECGTNECHCAIQTSTRSEPQRLLDFLSDRSIFSRLSEGTKNALAETREKKLTNPHSLVRKRFDNK